MERKKRGQLQAAPARIYEKQEQQKREEQPKQQQERQEQQQHQNRQEQPGWGTNRLIVAGIIILAIILVARSLSIADRRAEGRYDNVTKITNLLYDTMKVQLGYSHNEINSLKTSAQELQRMLDEEIRKKTYERELVQKKDSELQILVEERNQLQRVIEDLKGRIQRLTNEFNDEKKKQENKIPKCDCERQQMRCKEYNIIGTIPTVGILGAILVIGGVGVVSCGMLGGKR